MTTYRWFQCTVLPSEGPWDVYMVRTARGYLYTGITTDVKRRVHEHNHSSKGSKALKGQRPVRLVWHLGMQMSKRRALAFEAKIKKLRKADKEKFLRGDLPLTID